MSLWQDRGSIFPRRYAGESRRHLLVSGLAMLVLGVILAMLAHWLLRGGLSEGWASLFERERRLDGCRRTSRARGLLWLTLGGGVTSFLALVFVLFGAFSLKLSFTRGVKGD